MQTNVNRRLAVTGALKLAAAMVIGLGILAPASSQAADNPYNLIDPDSISVGTMGDAKPYVFTDADGKFTGFDAELFRDVARRMGFKEDQVIFTGQEFSALLPSVANGRFDVAVAAIGTTEARKKTVDFSDGYLAGYLSIISADAEPDQQRKHRPASASASSRARCRKSMPRRISRSDIVKFPDNNSAVAALNNGTIDGALHRL